MRSIAIRGARENNLRAIDLDLPLGALVVLTGVSGSGKSSLALDTLHAEGRRRYLEALSTSLRHAARGLSAPEVDLVTGLPPTIALEQRHAPPSSRSTVGTLGEILPVLRVLFARVGVQHCPGCGATIQPHTHDEIVASLLRAPAGTRLILEAPVRRTSGISGAAVLDEIGRAGFSRVRLDGRRLRLERIPPARAEEAREVRVVVDRIRLSPDRRERVHDAVRTAARAGQGVVIADLDGDEVAFTDRPWCHGCERALPALRPALLSFTSGAGACPRCGGSGRLDGSPCPACEGTRLRAEARAVRFQGVSLPDLDRMRVDELARVAGSWPRDEVSRIALGEVEARLGALVEVGLGRLVLGRSCSTLSTGELQRLRLARQVGARLSGVLYLLDEPTAGQHPDEMSLVVALLERLRDQGNTVVVVEHRAEVIAAADQVVEFGPGAGSRGGRLLFQGTVDALVEADTPTGRWLSGRDRLEVPARTEGRTTVRVRGPGRANLADVDLVLPLGALVAVVGPSGSGKTSLLGVVGDWARSEREGVRRVVEVDQAPLRRSSRSSPATYTGLWSVLRELLSATREARVRGMSASMFSLNVKGGRCEACKGSGVVRVDLAMLPDVYLRCEVCGGRRFSADVLEVRWRGHSADEILDLSVEEATSILGGHPRVDAALRALRDVGLGYLQLGQPAHTLSGGEAQRLRFARELAACGTRGDQGALYLLDDPAAGLHPADVAQLLSLLRRLVERGGTVWLATHDQQLARACDLVIRLGPGAGSEGGRVLDIEVPEDP